MAEGSSETTATAAKQQPARNNTASSNDQLAARRVVVHPIVLLSATDHYNRVAKNTRKRVVGMLLGTVDNKTVDVTSSYAVPFEEDERDPSIWFLDHSFHENMFAMFRKVSAKERLVGWYTTGPKIRTADVAIDALVRRYCKAPVMVIIDVKPRDLGIPTEAYYAVEELLEGKQQSWTFRHLPSEIGALEAEEVGVEHLLRDVKDMTISTLANQVNQKLSSLGGLAARLAEIEAYLRQVVAGELPIHHRIIYQLQDVFNLLPNIDVDEMRKAFASTTNDQHLGIYLASIVRSIVALHKLIDNKLQNKAKAEAEAEAAKATATPKANDNGEGADKSEAKGEEKKSST